MLKEGDKAPAFSRDGDSGEKISLADFAGRKLIVYVYPRDNTPGGTREAIPLPRAADASVGRRATHGSVVPDPVARHAYPLRQHFSEHRSATDGTFTIPTTSAGPLRVLEFDAPGFVTLTVNLD